MSVERELDLEVDLEANEAHIVERRELTVDDLFQDGELRLWEDETGWSGYLREEEDDGEVAYYHVNRWEDEGTWLRKVRVGEKAVHDGIWRHVEDPDAGMAGSFVRRCSPP